MFIVEMTKNGHEFRYVSGDGLLLKPSTILIDDPAYMSAFQAVALAARHFDFATRLYYELEQGELPLFTDYQRALFGELQCDVLESGIEFVRPMAFAAICMGRLDSAKEHMDAEKPPEPARPAKPGYVYLMRAASGIYKIGWSATPEVRVKAIASAMLQPVTLECAIASIDAPSLERAMHLYYAPYRVQGEWFALSDKHVAEIKAQAVQS